MIQHNTYPGTRHSTKAWRSKGGFSDAKYPQRRVQTRKEVWSQTRDKSALGRLASKETVCPTAGVVKIHFFLLVGCPGIIMRIHTLEVND